MYLFVYSEQSSLVQKSKLYDLLEKNKTDIERFETILEKDFWFALCSESDQIVAETVVSKARFVCSRKLRHYHITDLFVPEQYRGHNFAMVLILNLLYHFDQYEEDIEFRIEAYTDNIPAYRSYSKIFGDPFYVRSGKAYFSSKIN